ncbi:MAG: DoxX family membrane protein [Desulfobacteraceae bacterium]|nr:MAG: DoxX family membrane protein [Desulfobacteraceae bacterium]
MKVILFVKKIFTHRYLALVLRLYIGGLFIYASMYKINYPAEFAETVASYQIVPYWAVNIFAVVLPWVELISGVLLVAGIRSRSAAVIIGLLMIMFTTATFINLMRDAAITCGCFQAVGEQISWRTIGRDIIWLIMTIHIFFHDKALQLENRFSLILREI